MAVAVPGKGVVAAAVVEALTGAELDALDEAALLVGGGDLTDPGRAEAAATTACCWPKGKIKGPCSILLGAPGGKAC